MSAFCEILAERTGAWYNSRDLYRLFVVMIKPDGEHWELNSWSGLGYYFKQTTRIQILLLLSNNNPTEDGVGERGEVSGFCL